MGTMMASGTDLLNGSQGNSVATKVLFHGSLLLLLGLLVAALLVSHDVQISVVGVSA